MHPAVLNLYKSNELRNLVYYTIVYIMKDTMKRIYYDHLLIYVLFIQNFASFNMMALCSLSENNINYNESDDVIQDFEDFKNFYHSLCRQLCNKQGLLYTNRKMISSFDF